MALYNQMELAAALETTPGTAISNVYLAGNAKHLVIDPAIEYDIPFIERAIKRGSITAYEGRPGTQRARATFKLEMAGDTTHSVGATDAPTWGMFMRCCGFRQIPTYRVAFSATADGAMPARHGEKLTWTGVPTGGAWVMHDTYGAASEGAGILYIGCWSNIATTGSTAPTDIRTDSRGGGAAEIDFTTTSTDIEACGVTWWPVSQHTIKCVAEDGIQGTPLAVGDIITMSDASASGVVTYVDNATTGSNDTIYVRLYNGWPNTGGSLKFGDIRNPATNYFNMASATVAVVDHPTSTIALNEDGVLQILAGCRGTWTLDATAGEVPLMTFEMTGKIYSVTDSALLGSSVAYSTKLPPLFANAVTRMIAEADNAGGGDISDFYTPRLNSVNLALNNGVNPRPDANDPSGLLLAEITQRRSTGSIDPELDLETSFPVIDAWQNGKIAGLHFYVGETECNAFKVSVPGMQFTGGSTTDRNGIAARSLQFNCTGGHYGNLSDQAGPGDNEIVITYLTRYTTPS